MSLTTIQELPEALRTVDNLPSIPVVALQVLRLCKNENAGLGDFADLISRDPALCAKLLKLSNSSVFRIGREITSIDQATMVLGLKTVQLMSLSFSLSSAFPTKGSNGLFSFEEYWKRSLIASVAARSFCCYSKKSLEDEAFLCGLLSLIGQLIMAQRIPDEYKNVLEATNGEWPSHGDEESVLGYNYTDVGGNLLKTWELPPAIYFSVSYIFKRDAIEVESEELLEMVSILAEALEVSSYAIQVLCDKQKGMPLAKLVQLFETHGLEESKADQFLVELETIVKETAELLEIELSSEQDHNKILEEARLQMVEISMGNAVNLRQAERRASDLENQNRELSEKVSRDRLTGIANREGFDLVLEKELNRRKNKETNEALGLLIIDVDKFKNFNDTYGHQAGDEVLRLVGKTLDSYTRKQKDVPARYGGEEFALIVPQSTPSILLEMAERVRSEIEGIEYVVEGKCVQITASIGGACLLEVMDIEKSQEKLIQVADYHLYRCKKSGRNRCEVELHLVK